MGVALRAEQWASAKTPLCGLAPLGFHPLCKLIGDISFFSSK